MMSRIRSKDTTPELVVRRLLHRLGYRYRLHSAKLKGKPDLVFRSREAVVFVHGCYWHGHTCRVAGKPAQSNVHYWGPKIAKTRARDAATRAALEADGWRVLVVWECETLEEPTLVRGLTDFLGPVHGGSQIAVNECS